jgi:hypothetical protein
MGDGAEAARAGREDCQVVPERERIGLGMARASMRDRVSDPEASWRPALFGWATDLGSGAPGEDLPRETEAGLRAHARKYRPGITRVSGSSKCFRAAASSSSSSRSSVSPIPVSAGRRRAGWAASGAQDKSVPCLSPEAYVFGDLVPDGCDGAGGPQRAAPIDDVIGAAGGAWTGEAQTGQSVGFVGASIFRGCPWGMSCTAIVSASAVPLLRSVCSSLPPASMNPCPAV